MKLSRIRFLEIAKLVLVVLGLYVLLRGLLIPWVTSPQFEQMTASLGVFGYLIVIGYTVLSHVFVPLAGTPGVVLGFTLYGIQTGMVLLYVASLISAGISFYISRKFGRKWVVKLVGEKSMKEIDEFTAVEGNRALILSRFFGFSIFELISYAAGLTNIPFKNYLLITAVTNLLTSYLGFIAFRNIDFQSELGILIWMGSIGICGAIFVLFVKTYLAKRKITPRR